MFKERFQFISQKVSRFVSRFGERSLFIQHNNNNLLQHETNDEFEDQKDDDEDLEVFNKNCGMIMEYFYKNCVFK